MKFPGMQKPLLLLTFLGTKITTGVGIAFTGDGGATLTSNATRIIDGALHLASLLIDGGRLSAGAAVESLTDMSVTNNGDRECLEMVKPDQLFGIHGHSVDSSS